jgi:hypothetical protein
LQPDNVERTIRSLFPAIAALDRIAVELRVAVILPCQLPDRDITSVIKAFPALKSSPELQSMLVVGREKH